MKNVAVIGSTGSIGVNALKVIASHPDKFRVTALAAGANFELLLEQARCFRPAVVCIRDREHAEILRRKLAQTRAKVVWGEEGLPETAAYPGNDFVIFSVVGARGLKPLIAAIRAKKDIGFANKEPFVIAGELIRGLAARHGVRLLPIDSEHSAIFQCLEGEKKEGIRRIILTSSGGPFRGFSRPALQKVTLRAALNHPRWKMGKKITIDSATLMNKGLEVIEACHLFDVPLEKVDVLIHPEAIVHSMVEYIDGSHIAQLAVTDMRIPIQYALGYPERLDSNGMPRLDLAELKTLTFEKPDAEKFPCLGLGYEAQRAGGTMPAVLNAANEVAVDRFLAGKIRFTGIAAKIAAVMKKHRVVKKPGLDDILEADAWAREEFN
jgi:1-deoxy-D-xylulose-5-phosphate reductoisomerase